MKGLRFYPNNNGLFHLGDVVDGAFLFWKGEWYGRTPNGLLCNLSGHTVTVHDDGSITVSPSILVSNGQGGVMWHGFLERGVWKEC